MEDDSFVDDSESLFTEDEEDSFELGYPGDNNMMATDESASIEGENGGNTVRLRVLPKTFTNRAVASEEDDNSDRNHYHNRVGVTSEALALNERIPDAFEEDAAASVSESDSTVPLHAAPIEHAVPRLIVAEIPGLSAEEAANAMTSGVLNFDLEGETISVVSLGEFSAPTVHIDTLPDDLFLTCQVLTKLPNGEYKLDFVPNSAPSAPSPSDPSLPPHLDKPSSSSSSSDSLEPQ